ncbi:hypothetical protein AN933_26575 [Mycobacterium intracellulare subsp. chimaera]|nr:hypothetical protein AN933_26575 [Mycobacterium intracellulare subsp. chimaera]
MVQDAGAVVDRGLCDKQVRKRYAMPHAAVMSQVSLKAADPIENVGGSRKAPISAQRHLLVVVVGC